ncbi:MAG TPA: HlyD family efflux transporter periplasmic adaptor subunit [Burkholderiaceae bacterium]|nr:HlyD family efflux transporter periplasmic adaptor subunit [Burkholderiaceae bacterium]
MTQQDIDSNFGGRGTEGSARAQRGFQIGAVRRPALILTALVLIVVGIGAALYWFLVARNYEDTDDAYVGGRVVTITPQTSGTVVAIGADETDTVTARQMLVRLDPADARIDLLGREAQLAQAVRETRTLYANNDVLQANVSLREAELERALDDLERRREVRYTGVVSEEEIRHAELAVASAKAALASAREQLVSNRSLTAGTGVASHPNVLAAAARLREAYLSFKRSEIVAPVGGQIARRNVQVGQRVSPGMALMALVPMDNLWVDANFKEVQLEDMRIGQPVRLVADVYGSRTEYHGRIIGLGAGTGAAFALLPAQNATGNWIKVVQRVPVRIALDPKELHDHPLRVGLSVRATVDVRDRSGALVSTHNEASPDNRTEVFDGSEREAEALVERIIAGNNAPLSAKTASPTAVAAQP